VDVGLSNPDCQVPQDMSSILYVACTSVPQLSDLFVSPIYPTLWENIGNTPVDIDRRVVDENLKKAALEFASQKGMYAEVVAEIDWKADYSNCRNEKKALEDGGMAPVAREMVTVVVNDDDWQANSSIGQFTMCLKPVLRERHIGIDTGR